MSLANTVRWFLDTHHVSYEVLEHPPSGNSVETADHAFIWEDQLAKTVLLADERGYLMAVVPASHRVDLRKLRHEMHRKLELAQESDLERLFPDCEPGALPPLGAAYGIPIVYDDRLRRLAGVYFEGGDHCRLVYMGGSEFIGLLEGAQHFDLCA